MKMYPFRLWPQPGISENIHWCPDEISLHIVEYNPVSDYKSEKICARLSNSLTI